MTIDTLTPLEGITAFLSLASDETAGAAVDLIETVNPVFMRESIGLLLEATMDGRLQKRTGLPLADALSELNSLLRRARSGEAD